MYNIRIKRPFLFWHYTSSRRTNSRKHAAALLSKAINNKVEPAGLHYFLDKVLIIGGSKTVTITKR